MPLKDLRAAVDALSQKYKAIIKKQGGFIEYFAISLMKIFLKPVCKFFKVNCFKFG